MLQIEDFSDGLKHNYSIHSLVLHCDMHEIGVGHEVLNTYQESNNLTRLCIARSDLQNGGDIAIAETLRGVYQSPRIRNIKLQHN